VKHYRFLLSCLFAFLVGMSPSNAQTQSGDSPSRTTSASSNLSNQEFHCHTGYRLSDCLKEIAQLKTVLARIRSLCPVRRAPRLSFMGIRE